MSEGKHDTQFQGYAKLLLDELKPNLALLFVELGRRNEQGIASAENLIQSVIARRARDLVSHTMLNVSMADLDMLSQQECVERIPDLTEWPRQDEEGSDE